MYVLLFGGADFLSYERIRLFLSKIVVTLVLPPDLCYASRKEVSSFEKDHGLRITRVSLCNQAVFRGFDRNALGWVKWYY